MTRTGASGAAAAAAAGGERLPAPARGVVAARAHGATYAVDLQGRGLFELDRATGEVLRACAARGTVESAAAGLRSLFAGLDRASSEGWVRGALDDLRSFGLVGEGAAAPRGGGAGPAAGSARRERLAWVGFEATRRCNLRCPHCFVAGGEPRAGELSEAEARALFRAMVAAGAESVCLTGGEALMREDLLRLMEGGLEDGLVGYSLVTNGLLLDRALLETLARLGLRRLEVSLDGPTPEENARIRGGDPRDFGRALAALRAARELGLELAVRTVVHPATVARFGELVRVVRREGIPTLHASPLAPAGRARGMKITAPRESWAAFLEACAEARAAGTPEIGLDCGFGLLPWSAEHACTAGTAAGPWYVTARGDVFPCPALAETPFSIGNVREASFGDLVARVPPAGALPRVPREVALGRCGRCTLYARCGGGCRILTHRTTGNFLASPPTCLPWLAETSKENATCAW